MTRWQTKGSPLLYPLYRQVIVPSGMPPWIVSVDINPVIADRNLGLRIIYYIIYNIYYRGIGNMGFLYLYEESLQYQNLPFARVLNLLNQEIVSNRFGSYYMKM